MSLSHLILLLPVLWALDHPWVKNSDNFQIAERVQTERSLARETSLYLIIDLQEGTVTLKAKGVHLRSYLFQNFEWIGRPPDSIMAHTLRAKLPFIEPHVTNIPFSEPQNAGKPFVPLPITVKDMPHRFTLECSDEFVIRVHSERDPSLILHLMDRILGRGEKFFSRFANWGQAFWRDPQPVLWLNMSQEEAQALYWAIHASMKVLVIGWTRS